MENEAMRVVAPKNSSKPFFMRLIVSTQMNVLIYKLSSLFNKWEKRTAIVSYTNHLIEQQKIEKEELMRKALEKSMERMT